MAKKQRHTKDKIFNKGRQYSLTYENGGKMTQAIFVERYLADGRLDESLGNFVFISRSDKPFRVKVYNIRDDLSTLEIKSDQVILGLNALVMTSVMKPYTRDELNEVEEELDNRRIGYLKLLEEAEL